MQMVVLAQQLAVLLIFFQHLLHIQSRLLQGPYLLQGHTPFLLISALILSMSHSQIDFLRIANIFLRRPTDKRMIKGLLIDRYILPSVRIDVEGLHVVSISEAVLLAADVVSAIILKTLAVEVFPESCV